MITVLVKVNMKKDKLMFHPFKKIPGYGTAHRWRPWTDTIAFYEYLLKIYIFPLLHSKLLITSLVV